MLKIKDLSYETLDEMKKVGIDFKYAYKGYYVADIKISSGTVTLDVKNSAIIIHQDKCTFRIREFDYNELVFE